jgi:hypothetical protein
MEAENTYAVGYDPHDYHASWASFKDTTGTGMMMIVNGYPDETDPIRMVWGQEVDLPGVPANVFSDEAPYPMFANVDNVDLRIGDVHVKNSAEEICVMFEVTATRRPSLRAG